MIARLGVLVLLLASLVSCGLAPVRSAPTLSWEPTTSQPSSPACPESGVAISEGTASAAMGLRAMTLRMVNCGTEPYTVNA